jgi:hypothetical protein
LSNVTLNAAGNVGETKIQIIMLDLQSVSSVTIGGFYYEVLVLLANGSAVCDNPCTEFTGNLKFDATSINGTSGLPSGTLDLGVTGPTPTSANLGSNLPSVWRPFRLILTFSSSPWTADRRYLTSNRRSS